MILIRALKLGDQEPGLLVDVHRTRAMLRHARALQAEVHAVEDENPPAAGASAVLSAALATVLAQLSWTLAVATGEPDVNGSRTAFIARASKGFDAALASGALEADLDALAAQLRGDNAAPKVTELVVADDEGKTYTVPEPAFVRLATVVDFGHALSDALKSDPPSGNHLCLVSDAGMILAALAYDRALQDGDFVDWPTYCGEARAMFDRVLHRTADFQMRAPALGGDALSEYLRKAPALDLRALQIVAEGGSIAFVYPAMISLLESTLRQLAPVRFECSEEGVTSGSELIRKHALAMMWHSSLATCLARGARTPAGEEEERAVRITLERALETAWDAQTIDSALAREASELSSASSRSGLH